MLLKEKLKDMLKDNWKPLVSLAVGAVLVVLGIFRGEVMVVLGKATRICMECIGIG